MNRCEKQAKEFFQALLEAEEQPYFVSDEATLYDIFAGDKTQLIDRCKSHYGATLENSNFTIPLWHLLDEIEARRA